MAMVIREARNLAEVDAAYETAARVFGPSYEHARETKALVRASTDPVSDPSEVIVAADGGCIAGLVRLVRRRLTVASAEFAVAGVTSVAVAGSHRGQRLGLGLMEKALQVARGRGDDVSVLFARRAVDGWYTKFGYVGVGQHIALTIASSALEPASPSKDGLDLRPGMDAGALRAYQRAYDGSYKDIPARFLRDAGWWKQLPQRLKLRPSLEFLTVVRDGAPAGYAVIESGKVWEVAVSGRDRGSAATVARLLSRRAPQPTFGMHPSHAVMQALLVPNHTITVRRAWDGGHMLAALTRRAAQVLGRQGIDLKSPSARGTNLNVLPVWTAFDEF